MSRCKCLSAEKKTHTRKYGRKEGKEREMYVIILFSLNMLLPEMRVFGVLKLCRVIIFLTFRRKLLTLSSQPYISFSSC